MKEEYGIEDISNLKTTKAIEVGHIFQLGTRYQIIPKLDNEEKVKEAKELYDSFAGKAILDDRENMSMGAKIKDCKILGTPYMVILGDKVEEGKAEVENTKTGKKEILDINQIKAKLLG